MEFKDKRIDIITKKIGLSEEIASWCLSTHKKYAIWMANQIKQNPNLFPERTGDFQNILHWKSQHNSVNLNELTFEKALELTEEYNKSQIPAFKLNNRSLKNTNVVADCGENKWVQIKTAEDAQEEAAIMEHCVYTNHLTNITSGTELVFSLRDKHNVPHMTIAINTSYNNTLVEFKGKKNSVPKTEYAKEILEFLKQTKFEINQVSDSHFFTALKFEKETINEIDNVRPQIFTFRNQLTYGLPIRNDKIYNESIHIINNNLILPDSFKIVEDVRIESTGCEIEIGKDSMFGSSLTIQSNSIKLGHNIKVGGNLIIKGGLYKNRFPENLQVFGDIIIHLDEKLGYNMGHINTIKKSIINNGHNNIIINLF